MVKQRMRRNVRVPAATARVLRGLAQTSAGDVGFNRADLLDDATFNNDVYGFYGLSVWRVQDDWTLKRILAEKLSHAPHIAIFVAADLYESGLDLWDTGQTPHYDTALRHRLRDG